MKEKIKTEMIIDETTKQKLLDLDIEEVANDLGICLSRHKALCFMHDDHHPSLVFFPKTNRWKCFVCDKWGNTIDLVMEYLNVRFVDACVWLATKNNILLEGNYNSISAITPTIRRENRPVKQTVEHKLDIEVLQALIDGLNLTDSGKDFLLNKRNYDPSVIAKLNIKSADSEAEILNCYKRFPGQRLLDCGLVIKTYDGYHPSFHTPCLFFPYYDQNGKLITVQSRYLGNPEEHQRFQFPRGSRLTIFNLPILKKLDPQEPLFISEGVTDCIALLTTGKSAVAIPSATSLKKEDVEVLVQHPLAMYPDQDEPGQRLFEQIQDIINLNNGKIVKLDLPDGCKDYSAFLLCENDEDALFEELRTVRTKYAKEANLPPYCICSDSTLHDMVSKRPVNELMLSYVVGMGWIKVKKYGEGFLAVLKKHPSRILKDPNDLYGEYTNPNENKDTEKTEPSDQQKQRTRKTAIEEHRMALLPYFMPLVEKTLTNFEEKRMGKMMRMYIDGMNMEEIANEYGLSKERIRQLLQKAVKYINHFSVYSETDYNELKQKNEDQSLIIESLQKKISNNPISPTVNPNSSDSIDSYTVLISNIDMSKRLRNCLKRLNVITLYDLTQYSRIELMRSENFGKKCLKEVLDLMSKYRLLLKYDVTCDINDFSWLKRIPAAEAEDSKE